MKKYFFILIFLACLFGCASEPKGFSTMINSENLEKTKVSPTLNIDLGEENVIYCTTFELAWEKLKDTYFQEPIKLNPSPSYVKDLNEFKFKSSIKPEYFIAEAGTCNEGIAKQIQTKLKNQFNTSNSIIDAYANRQTDDIIAFSYLEKSLLFEPQLKKIKEPITFSDGKEIKCFGIRDYDQKVNYSNIETYFIDYSNYIVKINTEEDEVILACLDNYKNLKQDVDRILKFLKTKTPGKLEAGDNLYIPIQNFDITHDYTDLEGARVLNPKMSAYHIDKALQNIKFKINEKGAELESYAAIIMVKSMPTTKTYSFDRPYILIMKERGSQIPYLVLFNANSELLQIEK